MNKRPLGRTGLTVPPVCFGGNVFDWTLDRRASFAMLDRCLDAGLNFIDTADIYSAWVPGNTGGDSERMIGAWMESRGVRHRMVIATKVGMNLKTGPNLAPDYIKASMDASLKRLRTDYVDLYYAHRDDPRVPLADTLTAFGDLVRAGKARALGASNYRPERLTQAMSVADQLGGPRYDVLQNEYSLYERGYEAGARAVCARHDIALAPYYALASGFLTGKYRDAGDAGKSPRGGSAMAKLRTAKGKKVLEAMDAVAGETGASHAAIAIAWLRAKPTVATPIASATKESHFKALIEGAKLTLSADQMKILDAAGA